MSGETLGIGVGIGSTQGSTSTPLVGVTGTVPLPLNLTAGVPGVLTVALGGAADPGATGSTSGLGVDVSLGGTGTGATSGGGLGVDVSLGGTGTGSTSGGGLGVDVSLGGTGTGTGTGTAPDGGGGGTVGVGVGVGVGGTGGAGAGDGSGGTGGSGSGGTGSGGTGAGGSGGTGSSGGSASGAAPDPQTAYVNIFRLSGASEIPATDAASLSALNQQVASGALTAAQAVLKVVDMATPSAAVAVTSYQFFSGLTPTADGLTYLVHSPANATDLSDSYYSSFNLENRYINFASNLGLHSDYAPAFAQVFGPMSFQDAVSTAYDRIIGDDQATAAGVDWHAAVADIVSRQPYFQEVAQERFGGENQDLATKLAAVAYIMEESVRADVGHYGQSVQNFLYDLADGHAQFHVDLVGTYGHGGPTNMTT